MLGGDGVEGKLLSVEGHLVAGLGSELVEAAQFHHGVVLNRKLQAVGNQPLLGALIELKLHHRHALGGHEARRGLERLEARHEFFRDGQWHSDVKTILQIARFDPLGFSNRFGQVPFLFGRQGRVHGTVPFRHGQGTQAPP